jgi:hypothetical protein
MTIKLAEEELASFWTDINTSCTYTEALNNLVNRVDIRVNPYCQCEYWPDETGHCQECGKERKE